MSSLEKRTPRFQFVNGQGNFPRGQYNPIRFLAAMDRLGNFNDQELEDDLGEFEQSDNLLNMQRINKNSQYFSGFWMPEKENEVPEFTVQHLHRKNFGEKIFM